VKQVPPKDTYFTREPHAGESGAEEMGTNVRSIHGSLVLLTALLIVAGTGCAKLTRNKLAYNQTSPLDEFKALYYCNGCDGDCNQSCVCAPDLECAGYHTTTWQSLGHDCRGAVRGDFAAAPVVQELEIVPPLQSVPTPVETEDEDEALPPPDMETDEDAAPRPPEPMTDGDGPPSGLDELFPSGDTTPPPPTGGDTTPPGSGDTTPPLFPSDVSPPPASGSEPGLPQPDTTDPFGDDPTPAPGPAPPPVDDLFPQGQRMTPDGNRVRFGASQRRGGSAHARPYGRTGRSLTPHRRSPVLRVGFVTDEMPRTATGGYTR